MDGVSLAFGIAGPGGRPARRAISSVVERAPDNCIVVPGLQSRLAIKARQTKLARLKTVLDGVESRLDQAREIDRVRDNERARLREEMDYDYHRWGTLEQENTRMR
ncbi:unnamed protein product [Lupinus luteus]|uniref:Uncharacterized protein n=1 Tax=Lupinus luteus TaxID=3873 RepID=A0AAV1WWP2_LUPLU